MSGMASCREIRQALGVYVLGAIDPAERAQVDEHLSGCAECREELAGLAGLPAMLRKVPAGEAERLAVGQDAGPTEMPSEEMLESLLARTSNVRRLHRWRGIAAAAAVAIVALGGGVAIANAVQPAPPGVVAGHWHTAVGHTGTVRLTVEYRPVESGTQIRANVTGVAPGALCELRAVDSQGRFSVLGSWQFWSGSPWFPSSTWVHAASLESFQLTIGGRVVASAPA